MKKKFMIYFILAFGATVTFNGASAQPQQEYKCSSGELENYNTTIELKLQKDSIVIKGTLPSLDYRDESGRYFRHYFKFGKSTFMSGSNIAGYSGYEKIKYTESHIYNDKENFFIEATGFVSFDYGKWHNYYLWIPDRWKSIESGAISAVLEFDRRSNQLTYKVYSHGDNFGLYDYFIGNKVVDVELQCKKASQ